MISMNDFKKPDGSTDWPAYQKAQIAAGEKCYRCRQYISCVFSSGYETLCVGCKQLDKDKDEVVHDTTIRCPKCRHQWPAVGDDDYENYGEGTHDVTCPECEHAFEIVTYVSYSFQSPELIEEEPQEKETEDDEQDGEEDGPVGEVPPPGPEAPREGEGAPPGAGPGLA